MCDIEWDDMPLEKYEKERQPGSMNTSSEKIVSTGILPKKGGVARFIPVWIGLALPQLFAGCAALTHGRDWGESVSFIPSISEVREASKEAMSDPLTWLPAMGGTLFLATGWDRSVSDWATDKTPLFGSPGKALDASDNLREAAKIGWIATMILADSGDDPGEILFAKLKGTGVELLSDVATRNLTWAIKHASDRERPNGSDDESFPSGHSSDAFVHSSLAVRNADWIPIHDDLRTLVDCTLISLATGSAWARVEGGVHYPSDVLFGAALGNFMAVFFTEAFMRMGEGLEVPAEVRLEPTVGGVNLTARVRF